mgnify:CR=1 FL=1
MTNKTATIVENVLCVLLPVIACIGLALGSWAIHHDTPEPAAKGECYALATVVVEIDRDNDTVICEDSNGNLWEFYGCEDWQEGDCASLLMNSKGTPSIYDDAIEGARYSAWTLTR